MVFERSTVDLINTVVEAARITERGNRFSRPACLLVTLSVKNAFNSARWNDMVDVSDTQIPLSLIHI